MATCRLVGRVISYFYLRLGSSVLIGAPHTNLIRAASVMTLKYVPRKLLHETTAGRGTGTRHCALDTPAAGVRVNICILCETEITKLTLCIVFETRK